MATTTEIRTKLEALAVEGILPFFAEVQAYDPSLGAWIGEASGSSVAWLVGQADDSSTFFARVRVVTRYGEVIA